MVHNRSRGGAQVQEGRRPGTKDLSEGKGPLVMQTPVREEFPWSHRRQ